MTLRERYDRATAQAELHFRIAEQKSDELMGVTALELDQERIDSLEESIDRNSTDCAVWSNVAAQLRAKLVELGEMEPATLRVNS
jgi:hypothetical protein